jgi:hypothetical protein
MSQSDPDSTARNRFAIIQLVRIGGTVLTLLALLLWQGDVFVQGGSFIGFPIALLGIAISFGGPMALARKWRTPPQP